MSCPSVKMSLFKIFILVQLVAGVLQTAVGMIIWKTEKKKHYFSVFAFCSRIFNNSNKTSGFETRKQDQKSKIPSSRIYSYSSNMLSPKN